ncbi:MAG: hypothetical protein EPN82_14025 [Bacteroidetes bacterium]|nr:MAG: hypothetical protein EPN82_14025 [Bacteroidota bacterium]
MKKLFNLYFIIPGLVLFVFTSCQSPSDIDSPTKKIPVTNRIVPNLTDIILEENGEQRNFTVGLTSCSIDSSGTIPYVWMELEFVSVNPSDYMDKGFCINGFSIVLDSLPIIAMPNRELGSPELGSWTSFIINKSNNSKDTLQSGMGTNFTNVSFSFDKERKEMFAFIYTDLYFENNQKPDSTFFRTTLKYQY